MFFEDVTPIEKLHEIMCHASKDLAKNELENILLRLAAHEVALEQNGIAEKVALELMSSDRAIKLADSIAIDSMATILSHNE
jgi:hypothetical protein